MMPSTRTNAGALAAREGYRLETQPRDGRDCGLAYEAHTDALAAAEESWSEMLQFLLRAPRLVPLTELERAPPLNPTFRRNTR